MRLVSCFVVLALATSAYGYADFRLKALRPDVAKPAPPPPGPAATAAPADDHKFVAPTAADERGPCPALNTLANHGYISRNGKDINADMLEKAFVTVFGVSEAFAKSFVTLAGKKFFDPATKTLHLSRLLNSPTDNPPGIEHRASLSRVDRKGDDKLSQRSANADRVDKEVLTCSSDGKIITLVDMYKCREKLNKLSEAADSKLASDPNWKTGKMIGYAEGILAVRVFGGGNSGGVPVPWLRSFLAEEKIPADYQKSNGWGIAHLLVDVAHEATAALFSAIKGLFQHSAPQAVPVNDVVALHLGVTSA